MTSPAKRRKNRLARRRKASQAESRKERQEGVRRMCWGTQFVPRDQVPPDLRDVTKTGRLPVRV